MLNRILLILILTISLNYLLSEAAPVSKTNQLLPPIPGYIPVYIRPGNTPLEDINLDLAEAFRSYAEKHARLNSIRARSQNVLTSDEKRKTEDDAVIHEKVQKAPQHIQKIKPKP